MRRSQKEIDIKPIVGKGSSVKLSDEGPNRVSYESEIKFCQ